MSDPFTEESTGEPLASASYTLPPAPEAAGPAPTEAEQVEGEAGAGEVDQPLYVSPVLMQVAALDERLLPDPTPACETCPAAMWFTTTEEVKCFCSRMHVMTWATGGKPEPIMRCDGRELALMQMGEDMANENN